MRRNKFHRRRPRKAKDDVQVGSWDEDRLLRNVTDLAESLGWRTYHTWRSTHSAAGFPDLTMVRAGRLIFAELKSDRVGAKATTDQLAWLHDLDECAGVEAYLWWPDDLQKIADILSRGNEE